MPRIVIAVVSFSLMGVPTGRATPPNILFLCVDDWNEIESVASCGEEA